MFRPEVDELVLWLAQSIMYNVNGTCSRDKKAPNGFWTVIAKFLQVLQKEGMINVNNHQTYTRNTVKHNARLHHWKTAGVAALKPELIRCSFLPGEFGEIGLKEIIQATKILEPMFETRELEQRNKTSLQDKNEDGYQTQALADSEQVTDTMEKELSSEDESWKDYLNYENCLPEGHLL